MSKVEEQVSAYAVYAAKHKNHKSLERPKKTNKMQSLTKDAKSCKRMGNIKQEKKGKILHRNKIKRLVNNPKRNFSNERKATNLKKNSILRKSSSIIKKKKKIYTQKVNSSIYTNNDASLSNKDNNVETGTIPNSHCIAKLESMKSNLCNKRSKSKNKKRNNQKHEKNPRLFNIISRTKIFEGKNDGHYKDPKIAARKLFEWIIYPISFDDFFEKHWERSPLHIVRPDENYFKELMSTEKLDELFRKNNILFTKNVDVTSYTNGVKETHNPSGRVIPSVVWDYYVNGCSVRMLNPQTFFTRLHFINSTLQELFGCFVGANSYLTPPNSQGFAPHYDDIEAFVLQIEGKKRWRLYNPKNKNHYLARYSSKNFNESEIGEPIFDSIVKAGDLLYFPRGTIHQGETIDDCHSLHITLSVYQKNTWGDFLEHLLPDALNKAIETDSLFREGLPLDYLRYTGLLHMHEDTDTKKLFKEKILTLFQQIIKHIDIDKIADLMALKHMHDFLPPALTEFEQKCSAIKDGERMTSDGVVINKITIEPHTKIRLSRYHSIRLVKEPGSYQLYFSAENSKEYHELEPQFIEFGRQFLPVLKKLVFRYPKFTAVANLPVNDMHDKVQVAKDLWEKCIVVTESPLSLMT